MIAGRGPSPSLVLALVQRLPDTSLTHALMVGSREHFGWGVDRHMLADVFDALNINTKATGQWKKGKTPDFPTWPRPNVKKRETAHKPRVSVADIYKRFGR